MNESVVREVFERVLDTPRELGVDRTTMVSLGRRARRWRRVAWTGGTAVAAVAFVAVSALVMGAVRPVSGPVGVSPTVSPTASQSASPDVSPTTQLLSAHGPSQADRAYAQHLLVTISAWVPAGFTLPTEDLFGGKYVVRGTQVLVQSTPEGREFTYVVASTDVYRDGKVATVAVNVALHLPPVTEPTNLCAAGVLHQGREDGCQVATATNGARIRVAWRGDAAHRIWYATRFYPEGALTVGQSFSGMRPHLSSYGAVWTEAELVEVAADPELAPIP